MVTLQQVFDTGQTITVSDTDNQVLVITQNDTTNNPNAVNIVSSTTGIPLFIDHDDVGATASLSVDRDGTNAG